MLDSGSVDKAELLSLSTISEIFITTTYRPLINYTPAMGWEWIINMLLISISPIDFCHSFEMDISDGVFFSSFSWHLSNHQREPVWADISAVNSSSFKKRADKITQDFSRLIISLMINGINNIWYLSNVGCHCGLTSWLITYSLSHSQRLYDVLCRAIKKKIYKFLITFLKIRMLHYPNDWSKSLCVWGLF